MLTYATRVASVVRQMGERMTSAVRAGAAKKGLNLPSDPKKIIEAVKNEPVATATAIALLAEEGYDLAATLGPPDGSVDPMINESYAMAAAKANAFREKVAAVSKSIDDSEATVDVMTDNVATIEAIADSQLRIGRLFGVTTDYADFPERLLELRRHMNVFLNVKEDDFLSIARLTKNVRRKR